MENSIKSRNLYIMKYHYICPKCKKSLTKGHNVEFLISKNQIVYSKIEIDSAPEKHEYKVIGEYEPVLGDLVYFYCTECKKQLNSESDKNKVEILIRISDIINYEVQFSAICGVRSTKIKIDGEFEDYKLSKINFMDSWIS